MSVVGKSTCSEFKTGLYKSYHGGNAVRYMKQMVKFLVILIPNNYMTVLQIEQITRHFADQKICFLNLEQVNFHVTLVIYRPGRVRMFDSPRIICVLLPES